MTAMSLDPTLGLAHVQVDGMAKEDPVRAAAFEAIQLVWFQDDSVVRPLALFCPVAPGWVIMGLQIQYPGTCLGATSSTISDCEGYPPQKLSPARRFMQELLPEELWLPPDADVSPDPRTPYPVRQHRVAQRLIAGRVVRSSAEPHR